MRLSSILYFVFGFSVLVGLFMFFRSQTLSTKTNITSSEITSTPQAPLQTIQVLMKSDNFEPLNLIIKKGTKVVFVNEDNKPRWPASDLHPTHGIYPEFDPKAPVEPGENWSFVFDKVGTWKYHDHLSSFIRGQIRVIEEGDSLEESPLQSGHFIIKIEGKKIVGESKFTVKKGETVTFMITADVEDEFHVHGIDKSVDLKPGTEASLEFVAGVSGRFPIELEGSKTEIATLEVQPQTSGQ